MRKQCMTLLLGAVSLSAVAGVPPLGGYFYGSMPAPTGWEWQSPDSLAYNKQQPHAWFFTFKDTDEARRVLPENSSFWASLDGKWQFHWAKNPDERPKDFFRTDFDASTWDSIQVPMSWNLAGVRPDGTCVYGEPLYSNQRVIFQHQVKPGDWKGGVMRTPSKDWMTYKNRNEVGSYRRTFTVPASWRGRQISIIFDGVDSFFYLYVNGRYIGFSKNSRNAAEFDITPYLNAKGENVLAVEVYRHSDGSFLESQDMYRLPGIFRTVALTAKPQVQVNDLKAIPAYDSRTESASLAITAELSNLTTKAVKGYSVRFSLYENKLYSDENTLVAGVEATSGVINIDKKGSATATAQLVADCKVKPWSAEAPHRYTLVGELLDKKGSTVQTFSTIVGFRQVEIKETAAEDDEFGLAGRYYYINGQPVKLKGVNRHETNPQYGHFIPREQMEKEVFLMKRGNINHVRNSHYPDAPYWYYLCDKYGIYLEDEANAESHQYYYGTASLSHVPEFRNATIARNMEMVHATVNHPSVVIWSLGNEAGPGKDFKDAYDAIKTYDVSRPVQYERNNDIVDMGSNQYPSTAWVAEAVKGKYNMKYPFHISEYAHSMGNACGNLADYWTAMESTNFFMGGAIWDWVDQAMYNYDKASGTRYWAYGGDFGADNKPNDGMFCMNGVMRPDLTPKAQYYEVKKVYQNVGVRAVDMKEGRVEIFNKNYFEPLRGYRIVWSLWKDGTCILADQALQGAKNILGPRERQEYVLPYSWSDLDAGSEYFVKVQFLLAKDMPWAKKGYVQMEEQLRVKGSEKPAESLAAANKKTGAKSVEYTKQTDGSIDVSGKDFSFTLNAATGLIKHLQYDGKTIMEDGPALDAYRAPTDNDSGIGFPSGWFKNGLYNLQHRAVGAPSVARKADGSLQVAFTIESQGKESCRNVYTDRDRDPETVYTFTHDVRQMKESDFKFTTSLIYTVYPDGSIEMKSDIAANRNNVVLPRIGYSMKLNSEYKNFEYYGRGPVNNYADRKTGQVIERHRGVVGEQDIMLPKPQSMGNREDVRWCALTDAAGSGVAFVSDSTMSASALPWSQQQLTVAAHPFQLPKSDGTYLHLDAKVTGLGGASCGQGGPYPSDQAKSGNYNFAFAIRPVKNDNAGEQVRVSLAGEQPISFDRDAVGTVSLSSADKQRTIVYAVGKSKKTATYTSPVNLREGGTLTAWYKDSPTLRFSRTFDKVEAVPVSILFASSFEPNEGDPEHLIDGDQSTIWHTMYSVTVAKYPHWIDFDASAQKTIKGFTYTARSGSRNGRVKDYEIFVSTDGKTWGNPVAKGSLRDTEEVQRIVFSTPVKGRYLRFRALNSQDGQDFASAAEMSILAE